MSSNVLIPGAVVVVCLLIIFAISLGGRRKNSAKGLSIASPAEEERERNQSDDLPDSARHDNTPDKETLSQWHAKHENEICCIFLKYSTR